NGEIINHGALRRELVARGARFATRSDTEVLLQHVLARGEDGLTALDGMFAFAAWNRREGALLLARDRAGIKPLYWAPLAGGGLAFASELLALLAHPDVNRAVSPDAVASYFFGDYVPAPDTFARGAKKLAPGECLAWKDGATSGPRVWWSPERAAR